VSCRRTIAGFGALFLSSVMGAHAADINGVWASDVAVCNKVFTKKANCKIKTRKQEGDLVHLIATCATDVMLSNMELTLKVIDDNKIARVFAGLPELETLYYRCPQ
jgi:hypothetical protein